MSDSPSATAPEPPEQPPAAPEIPIAPSPGALLRQARERAGLATDTLATQLKLAKNTLEALERDDFAALSEPVYLRGYYRKIAKVLPVAEAELLAAYHACAAVKDVFRARPVVRRIPLAGGVEAGAPRRTRGLGLGLAVAAVVAVVLALLLADQNFSVRRAAKTTPVAATPDVSPAPAAGPADAPILIPPLAQATPPAPAPPGVETAAANQLVLEFSESSFVRVEDRSNKTLAIGLVRGSERQTLDGVPPYTLFLGNAKNVKVTYQGQPVDFSAHINRQNDTARFTVP